MNKNIFEKLKVAVPLLFFVLLLVVYPVLRQDEIPVRNWYLLGVILILVIIALFYKKYKLTDNRKAFIFGLLIIGLLIFFATLMYFYYLGKPV